MPDVLEELSALAEDQKNVIDEASADEISAPQTYNISSYGADYDVDGLVKRLIKGDVLVPPFQRDYVWNLSDASRFIESLLLGLPVPGVFFAKELDSNKSLVIDGQQRLKSLQFFYEGYFNPKPDQKNRRVFKLTNVQPQFLGKTYEGLEERDKVRLNDSIIHATVIKQEAPAGDDTSVYHVFERLNTGGRKLTPQEIRSAIYHGSFINLLRDLNQVKAWREIFGRENSRLKDQELILRFLAMYFDGQAYAKPMSEFLNKFCMKHRRPDEAFISDCTNIFSETISTIHTCLGKDAFRPERALNAAVFDSVMVAVSRRIASKKKAIDPARLKDLYESLITDPTYKSKVSIATSDVANVSDRIEIATRCFAEL